MLILACFPAGFTLAATSGFATENTQSHILPAPAFTRLSESEREYYEQMFSYVLETQADDAPYAWKTYSSSGSITPRKAFTSAAGSICRSFSEHYFIQGQEGTLEGIGCRRNGQEGWCKLKTQNYQSCALEAPRGAVDKATAAGKDIITEGGRALSEGERKGSGFFQRWWPF